MQFWWNAPMYHSGEDIGDDLPAARKKSPPDAARWEVMLLVEETEETVILGHGVLPVFEDLVLEIIVDRDEGLVWGIWWIGKDILLATVAAPDA